MSKRRVEAICAAAEGSSSTQLPKLPPTGPIQAIRPEDVPRARPKEKTKPCDRPDARLRCLDSLHARTQVQESLRLPAGRRIKLEDRWPDDLEASSPGQAATLSSGVKLFPSLGLVEARPDYSDDDLPEPGELLSGLSGSREQKKAGSNSSSAMYSDPEVDALIRSVQEGECAQTEQPSSPSDARPEWLRDALGDDVDFDRSSVSDDPTDRFSSPGSHGMKRKAGYNAPFSQRKKSKSMLSSARLALQSSPPHRKEKVGSHVRCVHLLTEDSHTNAGHRVHPSRANP